MNNNIVENSLEIFVHKSLREFIFGVSDISKEDITNNYIANMNYILMLAFFAFFQRWKTKSLKTNNRLNDLFASVYVKRDLTIELITYILTEIQVEVNHQDSIFKDMIQGDVEDSEIPIISEVIKQWKRSYKNSLMDISRLRKLYNSLINNLSFLKICQIENNDNQLFIVLLANGEIEKYNVTSLIKITKDEDYYLHRVINEGNEMKLVYLSFDGRKTFPEDIIINKELFTCEIN
jgi:hypothetical protein